MRIDADGDVGIGITNPTTKLHIFQNVATAPVIFRCQQGSSGNNLDYASVQATAVGIQGGITAWSTGSARAGSVWVGVDQAAPLVFGTNDTERMRITSAGDVGIGTNSPYSGSGVKTLQVSGTDYSIFAQTATTSTANFANWRQIVRGSVGGHVWQLQLMNDANNSEQTAYEVSRNANSVTYQRWFGGTTEAMRIDSSGNVQIGTTSANGAKLYINGIVASSSGYRWDNASSGARGLVTTGSSLYAISANGTTFGYGVSTNVAGGLDIMANQAGQNISFYCGTDNASPTRRLYIGGGGELVLEGSTAQKATGTTWSNPSDIRLKDNIEDYAKGLPELMQVKVKTWKYNGKGGTVKGTKGLGVVADEIEKVLPDTVDNYKAKLNADDAEDTEIKKFDATEITWLLVKTVQELKEELDSVKAELQILKGA
jgi:hypothetical protein